MDKKYKDSVTDALQLLEKNGGKVSKYLSCYSSFICHLILLLHIFFLATSISSLCIKVIWNITALFYIRNNYHKYNWFFFLFNLVLVVQIGWREKESFLAWEWSPIVLSWNANQISDALITWIGFIPGCTPKH